MRADGACRVLPCCCCIRVRAHFAGRGRSSRASAPWTWSRGAGSVDAVQVQRCADDDELHDNLSTTSAGTGMGSFTTVLGTH